MSKLLVSCAVLALLVPFACAPRAKTQAPAPAQPSAIAAAAPSTPKVVNVVGTKDALWSPWSFPDLGLGLPVPSALPSVLPWALPTFPMPSVTPAPTPSTAPTPKPTTAPTPKPTTAPPTTPAKKPWVILYGAEWCPHCKTAKAHIESRGIAYTYRNVDDDAANKELANKLKAAGQSKGGIPTTDIEGDLLVGWSQAQFDQMYDAKCK